MFVNHDFYKFHKKLKELRLLLLKVQQDCRAQACITSEQTGKAVRDREGVGKEVLSISSL